MDETTPLVNGQALKDDDPSQLFDAGRVLSDNGPHGLVVRASVLHSAISQRIGSPAVTIKIMAVGEEHAHILQSVVSRLMRSLTHASLLRYYGVWPALAAGEAWLVSDLCECGSVMDIIQNARVRDPTVLEAIAAYVIRNVLLALDYLHANDVLHGDVRANNFLVDGRGRVKVSDYGVHHVLQTAMKSRLSYSGARLWPAPEVAAGNTYDRPAEIWAIGISLLEIVQGRYSVLSACRKSAGKVEAPQLAESSPWSAHLREFVALACTVDRNSRASLHTLLQTSFIKLAKMSALDDAITAATLIPTAAGSQALYDPDDTIQRLRRLNNYIRAPLIDLDQIEADDILGMDLHLPDNDGTPAVELALRIVVQNTEKKLTSSSALPSPPDLRLQCLIDAIDCSKSRVKGALPLDNCMEKNSHNF